MEQLFVRQGTANNNNKKNDHKVDESDALFFFICLASLWLRLTAGWPTIVSTLRRTGDEVVLKFKHKRNKQHHNSLQIQLSTT